MEKASHLQSLPSIGDLGREMRRLCFLDVTVFVLETNHSMSQKLAFMHFEILKKNQHSYN